MTTITTQLAQARAADRNAVIGPWAANLITHSTNTRFADDLELVRRHRPPIVITALGSPKPVMQVVQGLRRARVRRRGQSQSRPQGGGGRCRRAGLHLGGRRRPHGSPERLRVHLGGARILRRLDRGRRRHRRRRRHRGRPGRRSRLRVHGHALPARRGKPRCSGVQTDGRGLRSRRPDRERCDHRHCGFVAEPEPARRRNGSCRARCGGCRATTTRAAMRTSAGAICGRADRDCRSSATIEPVAAIVQRLEAEYERASARFRSRTGGRT